MGMNKKTHDPFCPGRDCYYTGPGCLCSLIAQVRADERSREAVAGRRPSTSQGRPDSAYIPAR